MVLLLLFAAGAVAAAEKPSNLLKNPGFESLFRKGEWEFIPETSSQGVATRVTDWSPEGGHSLKLAPNKTNVNDWRPYDFSVTQPLSTTAYRGKPLYFGGWMRATGGATAVIRMIVTLKSGEIVFRELRESGERGVYWRDIMDVPPEEIGKLTLMCAVRGTAGAAYFDDVIVSPELASSFKVGQYDPGPPLSASIYVDVTRKLRDIPRTLYGMNIEWVFNGHTLWDRYNTRLNDHLLNLAADLGVSMWRYPGGVFANHYHWRNGIGPPELRPVVPTEPGADYSENGFGTEEALAFTAATGARDMMITVNSNTGTPEEAAAWVRYINNGRRRVNYWEIGNELYLRVADADGNPIVWTPDSYASSFLEFADAMREVDPDIRIGADVEFHYPFLGCSRMDDSGCWTDIILRKTARQLDFVSVHNGFAPLGLAPLSGRDAGWDVRTVYSSTLAFPVLWAQEMEELGRRIDQLAGEHAPRIKIVASEWGPLFDVGVYSRLVDHVKTLTSGLLVSTSLNALLRNRRVEAATAFKLLDEVVYGWIGPRQGQYVAKAPYFAFQMYARHLLPLLVDTRTFVPSYDSRTVLGVPAVREVPYLDVVSTTREDRSEVAIAVTNRHFDRAIAARINLSGFSATAAGTAWTLTGTGVDANTGTDVPEILVPQDAAAPDNRFFQGGPGEVWVESRDLPASGGWLQYEFPPHSVTVLVLRGIPAAVEDPKPDPEPRSDPVQ